MHLIASLTTLTATLLLASLTVGCAGNGPSRPGGTDDKSATAPDRDDCFDAQARGAPPPYGCPQTRDTRRNRTVPSIGTEAPLPNLPSGNGVGGVFGR